jgi:hypothetical protein
MRKYTRLPNIIEGFLGISVCKPPSILFQLLMVLPDFLREGRDDEIKAKYWIIIQEGYPQSSGTYARGPSLMWITLGKGRTGDANGVDLPRYEKLFSDQR